ncbi:four helix bundle protein [Candidatus Berkelbacteria bacterium]|nr:four helix bundle protein [Candidatus Berkelbacteria bacterium]
MKFSLEVVKIASDFSFKYSRIRDQLTGAVISIPLNLAEGTGRDTAKDKANFYKIARSSAFECIPLLEICLSLKLINNLDTERLRKEVDDISRMISGLINYQKTCF